MRKNYCEPGELSIPHGNTFFPERAFPIREKGCAAVEHSVACVTAIDTARAMLTVRTQGRSADLRPIDITEI